MNTRHAELCAEHTREAISKLRANGNGELFAEGEITQTAPEKAAYEFSRQFPEDIRKGIEDAFIAGHNFDRLQRQKTS